MAKSKKKSPKDKETSENENEFSDILPPQIFSSPSQEKSENYKPKNDRKTNDNKSNSDKQGKKTDESENDKQKNTNERARVEPKDLKQRQKERSIRFDDDVPDESKEEFPPTNSKSKRKVCFNDWNEDQDEKNRRQKADPDSNKARDRSHANKEGLMMEFPSSTGQKATRDNKPKSRVKSNSIMDARYAKQELPDMSSTDIVVEKGGTEVGGLLGEKGFISSLLIDAISKESLYPLQEAKSKPVSKQDLLERRSTIMDVTSHIGTHFESRDGTKDRSKSLARISSVVGTSKSKLSVSRMHLSKEKVRSQVSVVQKSQDLPPDLQHLKSGWEPADEVDEGPQVGFHQRKQSWVGVYVEGKDYWTKREASFEQVEVPYEIDQRGRTWYDLPVADDVQIEIPTDPRQKLSKAKIDAVKMQSPEELAQSMDEEKKKTFSFDDREPIPDKLSNDLYQIFLEFCKTDDLSAVQNRLSLLNADRSLEKVGLLDHKKLTLIHTGLCFKAAGGSRYRGLSFAQYKLFIEMIAETKRMPVFDFINRLKLGYAGVVVLPTDRD